MGLKKVIIISWVVFSLLLVGTSCTDSKNASNLPRSVGNTSEVLVVLQNQLQWDDQVGQGIKKYLAQEQYGMPQVEPLFKLSHVTVANFSDLFKKHRNLLIVEIDPALTEPSMEVFNDKWASPQRIFIIKSPTATEFSKLIKDNQQLIIDNFGEAERERIMQVFNPTTRNDATDAVYKMFDLKMGIPSGFYVAKSVDGFMWLRKEVIEYSQGIFIITAPYKAEAQFSLESIVARTNRALQQYVPGSSDDSYMIIDNTFVLPKATQVTNFPFEFTIETRGMWNVANDFMGGPFVSYTFVNQNNNQIVTLMGYIYYPNKPKRDLLRQLEAVLYSATPADSIK